MRYFLSCLLIPLAVSADPVTIDKKIICDQASVVIETLIKGEYKELPFWIGTDSSTKFSLLVNEKTKSWTLIQYNKDVACVLGAGKNHTPIFLGPQI